MDEQRRPTGSSGTQGALVLGEDTTAAAKVASRTICFTNTWRAERCGLRIVEHPIIFTERTTGASKLRPQIIVEAASNVIRWRVGELDTPKTIRSARAERQPQDQQT